MRFVRGVGHREAARQSGDRHRRRRVASVHSGDAGEVEQLQRAFSVKRRNLLSGTQQKLASVGRDPAAHLGQAQVPVDVGPLDRSGCQRARPSQQYQRPLQTPRQPCGLRRGGQTSPRAVAGRGVSVAARSKACEAAANPHRSPGSNGRLLKILDDRRVRPKARGGAMPGAPISLRLIL